MFDLEKACLLYEKSFPNKIIDSILDVGDEWVLSGRDAATSLELDVSPIAISKDDGKMRVFFPPANIDKIKKAIKVERKID